MKKFWLKIMLISALVCGSCFTFPQNVCASTVQDMFEHGHLRSVNWKLQIGDFTLTCVTTREGQTIIYTTDVNGNKISETVVQ